MTYKELAAALIMPRLEQGLYRSNADYRRSIERLADEGVLGFCVFKGELEDTRLLISELQTRTGGRLLFAGDFEHGLAMRLENGTEFPHAMALGRMGDAALCERVGYAIGRECRALGALWNFAPVCDVNSNPKNPIVNIRAFGETPAEASPALEGYLRGLQTAGTMACAKHFPGHGDTATDSHIGLPRIEASLERLHSLEFLPFLGAMSRGVRSVMTGHLSVPALDSSGTAASLSRRIVSDILRGDFGYDGVVTTDALDMGAIVSGGYGASAALAAISAGNDVALLPADPFASIEALAEALKQSSELRRMAERSLERLDAAASWLASAEADRSDISRRDHGELALAAAKAAVRFSGDLSLLPLRGSFAAYCVLGDESDAEKGTMLFHYLGQMLENNCDMALIDESIEDEDAESFRIQTVGAETVVMAYFSRPQSHKGSVGLSPRLAEICTRLSDGRPTISIYLGNPYLSDSLSGSAASVVCCSTSLPSVAAAALALGRGSWD